MSTWRFLGELRQAKTREGIRTQSLDGWTPWQHPWTACDEPGIVVPSQKDSNRFRHLRTYSVEHGGKVIKFAVDQFDSGIWRFFVPALPTNEGAFQTRLPRYEGFWRPSLKAEEDLPWPQSEPSWTQRSGFLNVLHQAEAEAERVAYRGFSHCRLCGIRNGSESLRLDVWEWPTGFHHYVAEHEVRPSLEFELFIREWSEASDK